MTLTTTAIGFSLLSLGLAFCGLRFFRAFQKIGGLRAGNKIGILLSVFFLSDAIALGILAIGSLFFAQNSDILYMLLVVSHFPLTFSAMLGVYLVFYIFLPSVSPRPAVVAAGMLGMIVVVLTIITHPMPFIDVGGGIDWNMSRSLATLLSYLVFLITSAEFIIFIHSFFQARSHEVKIVSLIVVLLALMGIVNVFTRFLLPIIASDSLRTRIFDVGLAFIGLLFIAVFLLVPVIIGLFSRNKNYQ